MNATQVLEKMPLPSTSFMNNKTLDMSSRSFMLESVSAGAAAASQLDPKSHYQTSSSGVNPLNLSSNISMNATALGKLNASYHGIASLSGGGIAHLLNQSMPANLPPMPATTQQFVGQDVVGLFKAMGRLYAATGVETNNDDVLETFKTRLESLREQSLAMMSRKREAAKNAKLRCDDESASLKALRQEKDEWLARMEKRRDELERLRADAIKCGHQDAFAFNQADADALIVELNEYRQKNEQVQK